VDAADDGDGDGRTDAAGDGDSGKYSSGDVDTYKGACEKN